MFLSCVLYGIAPDSSVTAQQQQQQQQHHQQQQYRGAARVVHFEVTPFSPVDYQVCTMYYSVCTAVCTIPRQYVPLQAGLLRGPILDVLPSQLSSLCTVYSPDYFTNTQQNQQYSSYASLPAVFQFPFPTLFHLSYISYSSSTSHPQVIGRIPPAWGYGDFLETSSRYTAVVVEGARVGVRMVWCSPFPVKLFLYPGSSMKKKYNTT